MSEIEEVVARAIKERLMKGEEIGDYYSEFEDGKVRFDGVIDPLAIARAAIDAYEAAKVVKVWPTVDYFNGVPVSELSEAEMIEYQDYMLGGGLVDRAVRETSEAIPHLIRGLNPFDDEPTRLRSYEAKWERPE